MYKVRKRDNSVVRFDVVKIKNDMEIAFVGCNRQYNVDFLDLLALRVTSDFEPKIKDELVGVVDIQDSV